MPVVDQNGFIITPGGGGPGVPPAAWHTDYTKEAQRLKKWRAMLGAPAWPSAAAVPLTSGSPASASTIGN